MIALLLISLFITSGTGDSGVCKSAPVISTRQRLKNDLLCNYDRTARPVKDTANQTVVKFNFYPVLIDLDDDASMMQVHTWLQLSWKDEFLIWKPEDYENRKHIFLEGSEIWVPDFIDFNRHVDSDDLQLEMNTALAFYNGKVVLSFLTQFNAHCKMDIRYWPNDRHTCGSIIGSKTYLGHNLDLAITNKSVNLTLYKGSRKWKLESAALIRKSTMLKTNYTFIVALQCNFTIKRHSSSYVSTMVLPIIGSVTLTLSSYWQHPLELPRIAVLIVSLIGHFFIVDQLSWLVPPNGETSVLILNLLGYSLMICTGSLLLPIAYRNMIGDKPLPIWLNNLRLKLNNANAAWLLFMITPQQPILQSGNNDEEAIINPSPKYRQDWIIIINIFDRLIFYILLLIYMIMFAVCIST